MVTEVLVEPLIEHGQNVIDQCKADGNVIRAAFWAKTPVDAKWYLYLVIDTFDADGPKESYRKLYDSWAKLLNPFVQYLEIKLIDKDDPIARSVQELAARYGTNLATWLSKPRLLGTLPCDELYIYSNS